MSERRAEISKQPAADPSLLNKLAWNTRWSDPARSRENAVQALRDASDGHGTRTEAQRGLALRTLSWHARWRGDFEDALRDGLKAEENLPEKKFPDLRAALYANLAVIHFSRGRFDLANSALERAESLLTDDSDPESVVEVLCIKGLVQSFSGERARAALTLGRARDKATGDLVAPVEHMIARWLMEENDYERAAKHVETAILSAKEHDNRLVLPLCYEIQVRSDIAGGKTEGADETIAQALELARETESRRSEAHLLFARSVIQETRGEIEEALATLKQGFKLAASLGYAIYQKKYALALAEVYERLGRLPQALEQHKIAWRIQRAIRS